MARKSFLTEMEKSKIDILKKNSLSNVKIAKEVGRSEHVVRNYFTLGAKYGVKSKTTGNQKLYPRAVRSIIHQATQKNMSSSQIKVELDLQVTSRRIQQVQLQTSNIRNQIRSRY